MVGTMEVTGLFRGSILLGAISPGLGDVVKLVMALFNT